PSHLLLPHHRRLTHNSTLFPYTTLFRSQIKDALAALVKKQDVIVAEGHYVLASKINSRTERQNTHHTTPRQTVIPELKGNVNARSEEHTSELQSRVDLVCRLLLEKKKTP